MVSFLLGLGCWRAGILVFHSSFPAICQILGDNFVCVPEVSLCGICLKVVPCVDFGLFYEVAIKVLCFLLLFMGQV